LNQSPLQFANARCNVDLFVFTQCRFAGSRYARRIESACVDEQRPKNE